VASGRVSAVGPAQVTRRLRHNGQPYSGINILSLWTSASVQGFAAPIWMTYRQAVELDAHVRKGEKGSPVVCANSITRTETDTGVDVARDIHFAKGYTVFNIEQIDGLPAQYTAPGLRPQMSVLQSVNSHFFALQGLVLEVLLAVVRDSTHHIDGERLCRSHDEDITGRRWGGSTHERVEARACYF
jgi:antirestriction protein ArdC